MLPIRSARVVFRNGSQLFIAGSRYPKIAPRDGVEVIVYDHGNGYETHAYGQDSYRWGERKNGVHLLSGPALPDEEWPAFLEKALHG